MKTDSLQQYIKLRRELTDERARHQDRLRQINEALGELKEVTAAPSTPATVVSPPAKQSGRGGKRTMSPEARARIAAAQKARWAKQKGEPVSSKATVAGSSSGAFTKPKRKMSAAGRKAIADAARRRWAAARAAGQSSL